MVIFPITLMDPKPVFKVTTFLKSYVGKTARLLKDKVTISH